VEDLIAKIPGYLERLGAAGGVIFFALWMLERKEHNKTREEKDKVQEKRIAEGQATIAVISANTSETRTNGELIRSQGALIQSLIIRGSNGSANP
jgi:hypothetical protein